MSFVVVYVCSINKTCQLVIAALDRRSIHVFGGFGDVQRSLVGLQPVIVIGIGIGQASPLLLNYLHLLLQGGC